MNNKNIALVDKYEITEEIEGLEEEVESCIGQLTLKQKVDYDSLSRAIRASGISETHWGILLKVFLMNEVPKIDLSFIKTNIEYLDLDRKKLNFICSVLNDKRKIDYFSNTFFVQPSLVELETMYDYVDTVDRETPINLGVPWQKEHHIKIILDSAIKYDSIHIPHDDSIVCDFAEVHCRYEKAENYVKIVTVKKSKQYSISKSEFAAFEQFRKRSRKLLLNSIKNNGSDIILGIRFGNNTEMPLWRKIGKRILDYTTSMGNGGFVTDSQCGFRAFNKKAVENLLKKLNGNAFTVESEQLIRAHELGLGVAHTNVTCKYKNLNTSTKDPTFHGFSVLGYVIRLVAERRPLLFIGVPGFILVLLGLFFGILTLQYYNETHVFLVSYAVLVSILLIIGVLAMFMGLMLNVLPRLIKQAMDEEAY